MVLPRFHDSHKEWRFYRRVELEWFIERTPNPFFDLQCDAERNVALSKKPDVAAEYVHGQFANRLVGVFAKWTSLKTYDGKKIFSVPNNAQLRTIQGVPRSKFSFSFTFLFSQVSKRIVSFGFDFLHSVRLSISMVWLSLFSLLPDPIG